MILDLEKKNAITVHYDEYNKKKFHKHQEGVGLKLNNKDLILSKIRLLSGVSPLDSHNL